jgi:sarcosine oxidase subunit alpha
MTRLPPQPGERIDRSRPLSFTFDGAPVTGFEGDTVASALHAAGRRVLSRSFKYHRPRGELCACGQCTNSLVEVDGAPGVRACGEPARDGMRVRHLNAWPSLRFDVMRAIDLFGGPFTPVGFYYKTFIRPRRLWPLYEKVLRHAAGLGRLPKQQADREWRTEYRRRHCDVLVVGGGIAGLSAAIRAAELGADVVLCDEDVEPGGVLLHEDGHARARELARAARAAGVEILTRATALGWFDGLVPVWQADTLHQIRAARHVIATGTTEQPLVFPNNDLPGVMLSGGARRLGALYAVAAGGRAVVATTNDAGLESAIALHEQGIEVVAVADLRSRPDAASRSSGHDDAASPTRLEAAGIPLLPEATVVGAHGRRGRLTAVIVALRDGSQQRLACDLLAVSGGHQPNLSLALQAGAEARYDPAAGVFALRRLPPTMLAAGAVAGHGRADVAELSGRIAGARAAGAEEQARLDEHVEAVAPPSAVAGRRAFVDLDEDVTVGDVARAADEGYDSIELSKRYTTATMGPSQGRFSQLATVRVLAAHTGLSLDEVGLTTARPPWTPVPLGVLAGRPFEPAKRSALHARHRRLGATVQWAGDWRRAYDYGDVEGEALAVHESAGLIDVSTLGKLIVRGPGAGELLDRLYPNRISNLAAGRIRYGVLLSEAGRITDDGTICRLDDETFYVTTTSTGAAAVEQWFAWWQAEWGLDAQLTDVTQGVAAMNLAGPRARDILSALTDLDCSNDAFGYLDGRQAEVAGVPCLLLRIGFVGELGYELHCPAAQAAHLWDAIAAAGARPFGLEPQRILRLQKLHILVGQDTDSESTPFGAAMTWIVKLDKEHDFVGRWALEHAADPREALVGFTADELPTEGAVVLDTAGRTAGQVTSTRRSPNLDGVIGMAWVPAASAHDGARIDISDGARRVAATVTTKPFFDPDGQVLRS